MSTAPEHRTALLDSAAHSSDCCGCAVCRAAGKMTAAELLRRCERAAALELRGADWQDNRADCAAHLLADALARCAPRQRRKMRRVQTASAMSVCQRAALAVRDSDRDITLPQRSDETVSLTALCGRAANYRRSVQRQRERDNIAHREASDREALSVDALDPQSQRDAREDSERNRDSSDETAATASAAAQRVAADDPNVAALIYRAQREDCGADSADIARELRLSPAALRKRCERGASLLGKTTTAATLLRTLTRTAPRQRWTWADALTLRTTAQRTRSHVAQRVAPLSLDWTSADMSRAAGGRHSTAGGQQQRERAADWRTLPDSAAAVASKRTRKRTAKLAQRTAADITAARDALATAQRAAMQATANSSGSAALRRHSARSDNRATRNR